MLGKEAALENVLLLLCSQTATSATNQHLFAHCRNLVLVVWLFLSNMTLE